MEGFFWGIGLFSVSFFKGFLDLFCIKLYGTNITWKKSHKSWHEVISGTGNRIIFK